MAVSCAPRCAMVEVSQVRGVPRPRCAVVVSCAPRCAMVEVCHGRSVPWLRVTWHTSARTHLGHTTHLGHDTPHRS